MSRLFAVVLLTTLLLGGCENDPAPAPAEPPASDHPELDDGDHLGYLRHIDLDNAVILVDVVTWVSDDQEPNGFRIEDPDDELWQGRLAPDVRGAVIDCTQACEAVPVELGAIAGGAVRPFNGEHALFDVVVRGGAVTSVEERYTP